ncbi:hypothetical protein D4764_13G0010800 [Takifugu flavidus]|uniref:Uncharacterized protein n=1 Tax=Takifugu flavidus TaxID=433684 RepID=A0A5C6PCD6_9TELE|nr:hypothetical protein D4764_13G0010800 [Takifugu flavidus]
MRYEALHRNSVRFQPKADHGALPKADFRLPRASPGAIPAPPTPLSATGTARETLSERAADRTNGSILDRTTLSRPGDGTTGYSGRLHPQGQTLRVLLSSPEEPQLHSSISGPLLPSQWCPRIPMRNVGHSSTENFPKINPGYTEACYTRAQANFGESDREAKIGEWESNGGKVPTGSFSISRRVLPGVTAPWTTMVRSTVCVSVGVWTCVCEVGVLSVPSSLAAGIHTSSCLPLHKAAAECVRVCEREREHALSLLSLLLRGTGSSPSLPPTLAYFSRGLNQYNHLQLLLEHQETVQGF